MAFIVYIWKQAFLYEVGNFKEEKKLSVDPLSTEQKPWDFSTG